MLEISYLRKHRDEALKGLQIKNFKDTHLVDDALALDEKRRSTQFELDQKLAEQNKASKAIGMLMKNGEREEAEKQKAAVAQYKSDIQALEHAMKDAQKALNELLYKIPNIPHPSVPAGNSEADNEVVKEVGTIPTLQSTAQPHWELTEKYNLISFELGNKISGAGFPVYMGKGAKLQRALISFFLDHAIEAGYQEVIPPLLVNEDSGYGTGQLPDKDGQMYHATADNLYLLPTAEVPVTNIYRDVMVKKEALPIKNTAYTPCFRREAGSYGKDVRGLNRLHQFDKVEIVQLTNPENSYAALDKMVEHVENLLIKLELPYRILRLCGGDTSFTAALTYDFEVWSAAQERWLEVSSVSNFETYQSNRLKCRFKGNDKSKGLVHTLNGSALALPRIVAALLENHQVTDGINIPKALQPYTRFEKIC